MLSGQPSCNEDTNNGEDHNNNDDNHDEVDGGADDHNDNGNNDNADDDDGDCFNLAAMKAPIIVRTTNQNAKLRKASCGMRMTGYIYFMYLKYVIMQDDSISFNFYHVIFIKCIYLYLNLANLIKKHLQTSSGNMSRKDGNQE